MDDKLPEPWFHVSQRGGVMIFRSAWVTDIYRKRKHWFPKRLASAAGWTENESYNNAIWKLKSSELEAIRKANNGRSYIH